MVWFKFDIQFINSWNGINLLISTTKVTEQKTCILRQRSNGTIMWVSIIMQYKGEKGEVGFPFLKL